MTDVGPALRVRGIRKAYPKVVAVDGLDLDVERGEVFGLLGPNGAGKTTTLEMIEGLTPPDAGRIQVLGLDWRRHGRAIRSRIGVQLQSTSLFNKITPREALALYGSYYPRRRSAGSCWSWSSSRTRPTPTTSPSPAARCSGWPWPWPW